MGYVRFFRRVRIAPGLTLNMSKSGPSLSLGVRGAHVTVGHRGMTRTVGLPGTGLYYTDRTGRHTGMHSAAHFAPPGGAGAPRAAGCMVWVLAALGVLYMIGRLAGS